MSCKNLYYHSDALKKIHCGGMCKRYMPVGMFCTMKEYKHLCRFYDDEILENTTRIEPVLQAETLVIEPIVEPISEPVVNTIIEEKVVEAENESVQTQPRKKRRGRPALRR